MTRDLGEQVRLAFQGVLLVCRIQAATDMVYGLDKRVCEAFSGDQSLGYEEALETWMVP